MNNIDTVTVSWEYTDTFGGEANYSWVRRGSVTLPANSSDRQIIHAVKADAGLTGLRMQRQDYGDMWEYRPYGICTVLFVTFEYQTKEIQNETSKNKA